ncbi:hypothetical protein B0H94_10948 [Salsuginibacillus halophilus]|uniref:Uncharacterized protein n=1 Tax=Salsuginibacillus halophilus TaxID=517424 RepID=A0A2P8HCZ1_9BACI|nr:hypothetical protein [Salsuginibacillus halophilus]PSL43991.1 hypothetical protein B0H94_10948 [Salsuginibacillus halophilus]
MKRFGRPGGYYGGKKRHRKKHRYPPWFYWWKIWLAQLLIPVICFQLFRTLIFPTTFDIILLGLLILFFLYCFTG